MDRIDRLRRRAALRRAAATFALLVSLPITAGAALAQILPRMPAAPDAPAAPKAPPAWVVKSDQNTQFVLEVLAKASPEGAGQLGVPGLDDQIFDLKPGFVERNEAAARKVGETLHQRLAAETDPKVKQDLEILCKAVDDNLKDGTVTRKTFLPYFNLTATVFGGLRALLDDQVEAARRPAALVRLRKYAGIEPGYSPLTELATTYERSRLADKGLIGPFKDEVERDLKNNATYLSGIGDLFKKYGIEGYEEAYAKIKTQLAAHDDFVRQEILPRARTDFRLPPAIYARRLEQVGVDMPADELVRRAEVQFRELQNQLQALAPLVVKAHGWTMTDYREVLAELKKTQITGEAILPFYKERLHGLEEIIRSQGIVSLPNREMRVRVASPAEAAATPAPNMRPPRLIGNTGEMGEMVLPLRIPGQQGGLNLDDFTSDYLSWTLAAHEGRPGHELQFAALIEGGVSKARAIFALNSVNVEGWALYAEAEVQPYLTLEGQMGALQSRLARAARAQLDPGLQAGTVTREEATRVLRQDVGLSEGMSLQEVQRYTFLAPGQATSYFCGYLRLMELRTEVERILGPKFNRKAFHDFLLAQGPLPPSLLRQAIYEEFIPKAKG
jgi:hypothetical protein